MEELKDTRTGKSLRVEEPVSGEGEVHPEGKEVGSVMTTV